MWPWPLPRWRRKASREANKEDSTWGKRRFDIQLTGTSVTFLEGSRFIISGLKDSIFWAFLLIAACMLYLFRSFRILICSLIPNIIQLCRHAGQAPDGIDQAGDGLVVGGELALQIVEPVRQFATAGEKLA